MTIQTWLQKQLPSIPAASAQAVIQLTEQGATLPFIARYRKEATGNLDEVQIQEVLEAKETWDAVIKRQAFILETITAQEKLTPELKERISSTFDLAALEDIYLPFKQKKKTKASLAREAGLEPLADWVWNTGHGTEQPLPGQTLDIWALTYRNETKGFKDLEEVLSGTADILTERLSHDDGLRKQVRERIFKEGHLQSAVGEKPKPQSKYEKYFQYSEPIASLSVPENSHRYMALRRGWIEQELRLSLGGGPRGIEFEKELLGLYEAAACSVADAPGAALLQKSATTAFHQYVMSSMETEVHRALKAVADKVAVSVFSENVRKLLLAPPFGPKTVIGLDPGIRTGCKIAVIDSSGKFLETTVLNLRDEAGKEAAKPVLLALAEKYSPQAIAVGNGTGGREAEIFVRQTLATVGKKIPVVMISEAGASVYSASDTAREEFPELDVTVRGAISIARRLQDPLAELVKIDPRSIGVGQYQHDIAPTQLKKSLSVVVDSCVNQVGVNLNTASYHLLSHVAGIGESIAKAITDRRNEKGIFRSRAELLEVPSLGSKAFEQAAGFLRIPESEHPLDKTGVHPERYSVLEDWAKAHNMETAALLTTAGFSQLKADVAVATTIGQFTWKDILEELQRPGRDPRDEFIPFQFREDIQEITDLKPGYECPGIVTNVTNFGAFVDIGVHQDGLVHLSQLSERFVKDPRQIVSPGDRVMVRVLEVNLEKKQVALSMKPERPVRTERPRPQREAGQGQAPGQQRREPRRDRPQGQGAPRHASQKGGPQGPQRNQPQGNRPQGNRPPQKPRKPGFANNPFAAALAGVKAGGKVDQSK